MFIERRKIKESQNERNEKQVMKMYATDYFSRSFSLQIIRG